METMVSTRSSARRLIREGEAAARRRAAELWDHWYFYGNDIEEYVEAVHDAAATVAAGPAPQPFRDAYAAAARDCIEKVIDHYHEVYAHTITIVETAA